MEEKKPWKETHGIPAPILKGGPGTTQRKDVIDDRDGSRGGYHTEHWDGRQDAHVMAKPVSASLKVHQPGSEE